MTVNEKELEAAIESGIDPKEEESAPPEEETVIETEGEEEASETPGEPAQKPKPDGFQKRINKVTSDKHKYKNEAEGLRRKVAELEADRPIAASGEPKYSDYDVSKYDYDEDLMKAEYQKDLTKHYVKVETKNAQKTQAENVIKAKHNKLFDDYSLKVDELGVEDFYGAVTVLSDHVTLSPAAYEAIMTRKNGPAVELYLSKNLDEAERIGSMPGGAQAAEIGELSRKLAAPTGKKITNAPDPVKPAKSGGGGLEKSLDDPDAKFTMEELQEKFG